VEVTPWNLVQYSEDLSNAIWSQQNGITVTPNTITAPNGTLTADTLEKAGGSGGTNYHYIVQTLNTFEQLTNFFYVKYKSGSGIVWLLGKNSGTFAFYDVINGTALSKSSGMTTSIESVGNGWYKCIFSQTYVGAISTEFGIGLCLVDGTPNYNATTAATQSAYIWGAQSSISATAKPYFPTTDRLNVPRLTYQNGGGGCPSLLLEKQSTNLLSYSEEFDNAGWFKTEITVTANNTTSPDGTANADKLIPTTTNSTHYVDRSGIGVSSNGLASIFAKKGEYNRFAIRSYFTAGYAIFDVNSGVIVSTSGVTATIENVGNGWYRCSVNDTGNANYGYGIFVLQNTSTSVNAFAGNGTDGIFVWGAQLEASSYPTSYIPTTSASATRVADACSKTGISSLIGQTEGAFFVEFIFNSKQGMAIQIAYSSDYSDAIYLERSGDTSMVLNCYYGGVQQVGIQTNDLVDGQSYKVAIAYKLNDFAFYKNGVLVGSDSSANLPTPINNLYIGGYGGAAGYEMTIKQAVLFKTRLTNTQLAQLTA
jgi:hypothetical protein